MEAVSKPLLEHFDPFGLTLARFAAGLAVLLAASAVTGRTGELSSMRARTAASLLLLGFLNTFLAMSLLQLAVKYSSASAAATLICSNPILVLLYSVLTGRERPSLLRLAAFAAGVSGVLLVWRSEGGSGGGAVPALASAAAFAAYTLAGKSLAARVSPLNANIVSFAGGTASLAVFMAAEGRRVFDAGWTPSAADIASILWLGLVVSGAGYLAFFGMLKSSPASSASLVFFAKPAVATLLSMALLGETPGAGFLPGLVLVTAGSAAGLLSETTASRGTPSGDSA
ncbi:EamA family transporter [Candidatus Fermentibacteria bacterium]|nr:EamA family transporter [Candidatus Fermentibacteria bacterium]